MSADVETAGYVGAVPPPGFALPRAIRRIVRAGARFMGSLRAAQMVVRRAERYYAMSELELARLGLTRDDVPAELLRVLNGRQWD